MTGVAPHAARRLIHESFGLLAIRRSAGRRRIIVLGGGGPGSTPVKYLVMNAPRRIGAVES